MNPTRLLDTLNRAKAVIDVTSTPEFDRYTQDLKMNGYINMSESNDMGFSNNIGYKPTPVTNDIQDLPVDNIQRSKLPKAILESIAKDPLIVPSVHDLESDHINRLMEKIKPDTGKPRLNERLNQSQPIAQTVVQTPSIDYSIIKTLTEDIVKRYVSALKKQLITETRQINESNQMKGVRITNNKIQVVDMEGNIYEAELKLKGKMEKKKTL